MTQYMYGEPGELLAVPELLVYPVTLDSDSTCPGSPGLTVYTKEGTAAHLACMALTGGAGAQQHLMPWALRDWPERSGVDKGIQHTPADRPRGDYRPK